MNDNKYDFLQDALPTHMINYTPPHPSWSVPPKIFPKIYKVYSLYYLP